MNAAGEAMQRTAAGHKYNALAKLHTPWVTATTRLAASIGSRPRCSRSAFHRRRTIAAAAKSSIQRAEDFATARTSMPGGASAARPF